MALELGDRIRDQREEEEGWIHLGAVDGLAGPDGRRRRSSHFLDETGLEK